MSKSFFPALPYQLEPSVSEIMSSFFLEKVDHYRINFFLKIAGDTQNAS